MCGNVWKQRNISDDMQDVEFQLEKISDCIQNCEGNSKLHVSEYRVKAAVA